MSDDLERVQPPTVTSEKCDHETKPSSTTARIVAMGEACPLCGERA